LLQPDQPVAGVGGERPLRHGRRAAGDPRRRLPARAAAAVVARSRHVLRRGQPRRDQRMKTVRRLLYRDIVSSVAFVALAFLSLFFFIDFVDDLEDVGKDGYTVVQAALHSLYEVPA